MSLDELRFLPEGAAADTLAALVMDLAAQLHIERQARLALQTALERDGTVTAAAIDPLADDPAFLERARGELDRSMARLMRILKEAGDRTGPLRAESPAGGDPSVSPDASD